MLQCHAVCSYLVGCRFPVDAAVYPDQHARLNPDASDAALNTPCGIYEAKCGTEKWLCSYGHDEYLFQVLQGNRDAHTFPQELWNIIRFHSLCGPTCSAATRTHVHAQALSTHAHTHAHTRTYTHKHIRTHTLKHTPIQTRAHQLPLNASRPLSYPWHTGTGSGGAYTHLMTAEDHLLKTRVLKFNECAAFAPHVIAGPFMQSLLCRMILACAAATTVAFDVTALSSCSDVRFCCRYDLYSKSDDEFRITAELVKYYDDLLDHFFPEPLRW